VRTILLGCVLAWLGPLSACAGANGDGPVPAAASTAGATQLSLTEWEAHWLAELGATDLRLAMRLPARPSAAVRERASADAVVRGADIVLVDGTIDPFSFDERARRLHALRAELRTAPDDRILQGREERALLERILDAEELRVAEERLSPESGSERVRAIVATWGHPSSTADVDARELEIARGLVGVIAGLGTGRLSRPRILELEDALDPLERLAVPEGYPEAAKTITSLRVELGKAPTTGSIRDAASALSVELSAYLGVHEDRDALIAHLDEEEATLRRDAKAALARLPGRASDDALTAAATRVQLDRPCAPRESRSLARALRPPPERAFVCDILTLIVGATVATDDAMMAVALHDAVAISLWALALDKGATDLDVTRTDHPLMGSVPHDRQDRLVRAALVSPVRAVAAGLAVALLDAEGPDARQARAKAWLAFGDAPFDIVSNTLAAKTKRD
jgi:hypothetical protein